MYSTKRIACWLSILSLCLLFASVFFGNSTHVVRKGFVYRHYYDKEPDSLVIYDKAQKVDNWMTGELQVDNPGQCPRRGDILDWTLKCKYKCKAIDMTTARPQRVQLVPVCDLKRGYLVKEVTYTTDSVPVLQFKHQCVQSFLHHNCSSKLPVPNVIHYVWYGMRPMRFYHFLSVYSSFKIQKPCVIFIHGDFMPTGEYWNFLLTVVPNIIFLQQVPPVKIADRTILHIEHKADITRLMVLKALS
ncbi:uncharacterized protein LOC110465226 isoform X2 [Mizuhopecten yessoensis]|uniref:uncharacterized protein LOC110465226 isoform X2 n=1 Tax=Mizuhopecten yessoensis TaxID=6573 RepID=UPI000B45E328|nr:uncharacterized protein LOC110465226 isoform X2 [Mizuhopecten yessoensis]